MPFFPLKTCLLGYPLKQGVFSLLTIELVIGVLAVLGIFYSGELNLPNILSVMMATVMAIIAGLGLYGVAKEKPSHFNSYVIVQLILVVLQVLGILGLLLTLSLLKLIPGFIELIFMAYTLLVAASYQKEIQPGQTPPSDIP